MNLHLWVCRLGLVAALLQLGTGWASGETFRVATFNLGNFLDVPEGSRPAKSPEGKAGIVESILAMRPDLIALEEMGRTNALLELRDSLKKAGLDFPFWEHISATDTNIHLALLSRFEFTARRPHTNETYLLSGRRFRVSRGFAEVDVSVNANYKFTAIAVHLKSRLPSPLADEAEMREQEAKLLAELVKTRLTADPKLNLVVLGDFNDTRDSKTIRALIGRGKTGLFDTRPSERHSEPGSGASPDLRAINWTYFYGKEDVFSRIDYIMLSPGMKREWVPEGSYVLNLPHWGVASDHRPVVCTFEADDR